MPTNSDKIDDAVRLLTTLTERLDGVAKRVEELGATVKETKTALDAIVVRVALAERETAELRKSRDEWGRRGWRVGPERLRDGADTRPVATVVVTGVVGAAAGYLLKR